MRNRIAQISGHAGGSPHPSSRPPLRFGLHEIDSLLPSGGLAVGALHEVMGAGPDTEHAAVPSLLVAGLLARHERGPVFWAMRGRDLFPPGLAGVGLGPGRVILAECGRDVLAAMEEALRHPALGAVVGEVDGPFGLVASRRLQLAAARSGVTAFALRRSRRFDDPALSAPSAASSRWRVSALPAPGRDDGALDAWPGRAAWRLDLLRCRDTGLSRSWWLEACDATGRITSLERDVPDLRSQRRSFPADRVPVAAVLGGGAAASFGRRSA
ncbi:damage-inducible mutagenesis protein [Acetobacteraceae bacterium KSS12]|uniref:Damage-inducible mutagenesis protein n=1 Tax=Rhizosaccharibacter radicis TaxID=2782605 RepID=A0ABT1VZP9_9PROT|nr:damage-inducible mutagenesis protein [Acetobacteraceae bacterium KSS12]